MSSESPTDQERILDHANWQMRVDTYSLTPEERNLGADDIAYATWLANNAVESSGRTLKQRILDDVETAKLERLREVARISMRAKTGMATKDEVAEGDEPVSIPSSPEGLPKREAGSTVSRDEPKLERKNGKPRAYYAEAEKRGIPQQVKDDGDDWELPDWLQRPQITGSRPAPKNSLFNRPLIDDA